MGLHYTRKLARGSFTTVGGEWFAMWQSETWNGQSKAFEFIGFIGLVLIVLLIRERTDNVR